MRNFQQFINEIRYRRDRFFLLILSKDKMSREEIDIFCAKNNIIFLDYRKEIINNLFPGQVTNIFEFDNELKRIQDICKIYSGKVILFYNFDLVLSYFDYDTRKLFWRKIYSHLPHLEAIPGIALLSSSELLPNKLLEWEEENRVFVRGISNNEYKV